MTGAEQTQKKKTKKDNKDKTKKDKLVEVRACIESVVIYMLFSNYQLSALALVQRFKAVVTVPQFADCIFFHAPKIYKIESLGGSEYQKEIQSANGNDES